MKRILVLLVLGITFSSSAQQMALKKGVVIDGIKVNDSLPESYALFLPSNFDTSKKWPVVFIFDMDGRGKQVTGMFSRAGEQQGYILAASNNLRDSLSISQNVLIANRMFSSLLSLLPIAEKRIYMAGFSSGAQLASLIPTFIKGVGGVISCGATIANMDVLSSKNPFHYIGIVGDEDYNYQNMLNAAQFLDKLKFPNQLLIFEGGHEWPTTDYLSKAMEYLTVSAMGKGSVPKDKTFIDESFDRNLGDVSALITSNMPLRANHALEELMELYKPHKSIDSLKDSGKTLRKSKLFKTQNRNQNTIFFKENLIKDDYSYYLEEDILTYNYNNLGWWNYQMEELKKYDRSSNLFERKMGKRLKGYLNALIADNIDMLRAEEVIDEEALNFLWMLKTITDPADYSFYLKIISYSAKNEDYGTSLFYLEELFKNGYTDKNELYALEGTALLRITPEFNAIVEKYLKSARYDILEE